MSFVAVNGFHADASLEDELISEIDCMVSGDVEKLSALQQEISRYGSYYSDRLILGMVHFT